MNAGARAAGVAMHVGEAFLHDAEKGDLCVGRQAHEIGGNLNLHLDAGPALEPSAYHFTAEERPSSSSSGGWSK